MLLPLAELLSATLENALNRLLAQDSSSAERARPLRGKVLRLEIRELRPLWFIFSAQRIDLLTHFDGPADAGVSLDLAALPRLRDKNQLSSLIREGKVDLQGDPALFNCFAILLGELEIDWEGKLARYLGDVPAHLLCRQARQLHQGLARQLEISRQDLAEYLTEEARLAPGPLEVACFCEDVSALKRRFDATALRLERLAARVGL
ncbi:MAG: ubiquinone biosynthesis accessory factor UbiJ [Aeromonadaceae bacterium]